MVDEVIHRDLVALWHERLRNAPRVRRKRRRCAIRGVRVTNPGTEWLHGAPPNDGRQYTYRVTKQAPKGEWLAPRAGGQPLPRVSPLTYKERRSLERARNWNNEGVRGSKRHRQMRGVARG